MMHEISEPDWRRLRDLQPTVLERFYRRALGEVEAACRSSAPSGQAAHERYAAVVRRVQEQEQRRRKLFDDLRRSVALLRLAELRAQGLIDDAEFAAFSSPARTSVAALIAVR